MKDTEDISIWIARLSEGDEQAVNVVWAECFERLVSHARGKILMSSVSLNFSPFDIAGTADHALHKLGYAGSRAIQFPVACDQRCSHLSALLHKEKAGPIGRAARADMPLRCLHAGPAQNEAEG